MRLLKLILPILISIILIVLDTRFSYLDNFKRFTLTLLSPIYFVVDLPNHVVDWVNETHEITKNIYKSVSQGEDLKYKYSYEHMGLVRTQLQKAGLRLASLLNNILC